MVVLREREREKEKEGYWGSMAIYRYGEIMRGACMISGGEKINIFKGKWGS